jgi:hypothetical protein
MPKYRRRRRYRRRYPSKRFKTLVKKAIIANSTKYIDYAQAVTTFYADSSPTSQFTEILPSISQGDGETQRDGNIIHHKSMEVHYEVTSPTVSAEIVRLLVVQYEGSSAPTLDAILATEAVLNNKYLANYRKTSQQQFTSNYSIIVDKDIVLSAGRSTKVRGRMKFNLLGKKTVYNGSAGINLEKGSFYAILLSDQLTSTGSKASMLVNVRSIWSDNI